MDAARLLLACTVQVGILEMWILGGGGGLQGCGRAGATSRLALWQEGQSRSAGPQHTCPCVSRPPPNQSVCGRVVADGLLYNCRYSFPLLTSLISNQYAAVPSSQHPFLGNLLFKVLGRL